MPRSRAPRRILAPVTTPTRARAPAARPAATRRPADAAAAPDAATPDAAPTARPAAGPRPTTRRARPADSATGIRTAARGDVHELLVAAVDEAARLLDADGAMVYLVDPATGHLRFAHDAGIRSRRSREWVRSIDLPVGVGMFGRAVAERAVVLTSDYLADAAFAHARGHRSRRPRHRHPLDGRRAARRRRDGLRGAGHLLVAGRRVQPVGRSGSSAPWPTTPPRRWPTSA